MGMVFKNKNLKIDELNLNSMINRFIRKNYSDF